MSPASVMDPCPPDSPNASCLFVHVFYDSAVMQSASAILCDQLRVSFHADLEVRFLWSHFQRLADSRYSREAAEVASQSDVVVLATTSHDTLPGTVARWLGAWICQHHKPDSMFCGLFLEKPEQTGQQPPVARLLEATAKLTGRAWLAGFVHQPSESSRVAPHLAPAIADRLALVHEPSGARTGGQTNQRRQVGGCP